LAEPHPTKAFEVLHICRSEISDAEGPEAEGVAGVVDAAVGEVREGSLLLKFGVEFAAARRKAEGLPTGMLTVALDDSHGFWSGERLGENGRISQQHVDLAEQRIGHPRRSGTWNGY
jgi:hypothetical protein